jgi:hypothetical protein
LRKRAIFGAPKLRSWGRQLDQEAILRGIASAYIAFACRLNAKDEAKELLLDLAEKLDDPATLHWVHTHFTAPVSRGLLLAHALALRLRPP